MSYNIPQRTTIFLVDKVHQFKFIVIVVQYK